MEPDGLDSSEAQNLESETERRYHELKALSRVSAALSDLWNLDAVLKVGLENVLDIMNGSIGGILLIDEQTGTLSYRIHHGLSTRISRYQLCSCRNNYCDSLCC